MSDPESVHALADAGASYAQAGDTVEECRLMLLTARALVVAQQEQTAQEILSEAMDCARREPRLALEWRLARACCGHPETVTLLRDVLEGLPSPVRDHDRILAGTTLGMALLHGSDVAGAREVLEAALQLAQQHDDPAWTCKVSSLLGNLLLEQGLPAEAEPLLDIAIRAADRCDDDLTLVAEGTILTAVQVGRQDWTAALATSRLLALAAERRENWLGVVDACITQSSCLRELGELEQALRVLLNAAGDLRARGSEASVNLLKARLAELRSQIGPEAFDPIWKNVIRTPQ
ncbi:MAG: hypothetical protein QGG40_00280, partial [Myxococcota bacterium]|jgi:tetratricopeptide (TPR) repeat protein|nr:hypothetical protein [Myxococcota bacterium]